MSLLDFGTVQGLAYRHNYQQDISNLHQEEQLDAMAKQRAKQETAEMANMFKFGSANNEFDRNNLREFTNTKIKEMGNYFNQNPDWKYDTGKTLYARSMSDQLLNNEHVKRSMYYDSQVKATQDYLEKNAGALTDEELNKYKTQMQNRAKYGDIDGPGGKGGDYTFVPPPLHPDFDKHLKDIISGISPSEITKMGGGNNLLHASDRDVDGGVNAVLADQKMNREAQLRFNAQSPEQLAPYQGMSKEDALHKFVKDRGNPFVPKKIVDDRKYYEYLKASLAKELSPKEDQNPFGTAMNQSVKQISGMEKPTAFAKSPISPTGYQVSERGKDGVSTFEVPPGFANGMYHIAQRNVVAETSDGLMPIKMPAGVKVTPTGEGQGRLINGKHQPYAVLSTDMNLDQAKKAFGEDAFDEDGNPTGNAKELLTYNKTLPSGDRIYSMEIMSPFQVNETNNDLWNKAVGATSKESRKKAAEFKQNKIAEQPTNVFKHPDGSLWEKVGEDEYVPYNQ